MRELLKKIRKLEIKTRRMVEANFAGEYHSAFKGQGLEFDEVRPYQYGDDIRSIDWNVTAKTNQVFIKEYREEREQTLMLIFDVSGSEDFGGEESNKLLKGTEIAAILAFSAMKNNDKVGLVTFTSGIESYFRPKKGRKHVLAIIRSLLLHKAEQTGTDFKAALDFVRRNLKKRSIIVLISDFLGENYELGLRQMARKHDVILIRLFNPAEIPPRGGGIVPVRDNETGVMRWINRSNTRYRNEIKKRFREIGFHLEDLGKKARLDVVEIHTDREYISDLERFFRKRNARK